MCWGAWRVLDHDCVYVVKSRGCFMGNGRVIPPLCPSCGVGGTDGHRHNLSRRIYVRSRETGVFAGRGGECPNGHRFSDEDAARFGELVRNLADVPQG